MDEPLTQLEGYYYIPHCDQCNELVGLEGSGTYDFDGYYTFTPAGGGELPEEDGIYMFDSFDESFTRVDSGYYQINNVEGCESSADELNGLTNAGLYEFDGSNIKF